MTSWQTPVYDRNQFDVDQAKIILEQWRLNGQGDYRDLKGCLNISDLNRIENNSIYLAQELTRWGYFVQVDNKVWVREDIPKIEDIERIIQNIKKLLYSFYKLPHIQPVPESMTNYIDVNTLEHLIWYLNEALTYMVKVFQKVGVTKCGRRGLPVQREEDSPIITHYFGGAIISGFKPLPLKG